MVSKDRYPARIFFPKVIPQSFQGRWYFLCIQLYIYFDLLHRVVGKKIHSGMYNNVTLKWPISKNWSFTYHLCLSRSQTLAKKSELENVKQIFFIALRIFRRLNHKMCKTAYTFLQVIIFVDIQNSVFVRSYIVWNDQ